MLNLSISWRIAQLGALAAVYLLATSDAKAQQFGFPSIAAIEDSATIEAAMPRLASEVMAAYREDNRGKYLDNLFRLQIVAGQYAEARNTIASLRALRDTADSPQAQATNVQYAVFARARQRANGSPLEQALRLSFREALRPMADRVSALVMRALASDRSGMQRDLSQALQQQRGKTSISLADALSLIKAYQVEQTFRSLAPLTPSLIAEDDGRRYIIDSAVRISTPDGATVCALVVRQRSVTGRQPALLNFTIYANPVTTLNEARRSASNGYAGVTGLTRGKGCSPDQPIPYEHDGSDAAAVIDWISRQPWSDGRVGMFGGSYEGFTQWAAAKRMPKALKALMPSVAVAPGVDVPMEGGVFQSFVYSWPFYTTTNKTLDDSTYNDNARWARVNRQWYTSGRAYRALDEIDGTPNPFFRRWLDHPSYDSYWQGMIPQGEEFARIDIPVLTTTGYYDGAQIGALHYFTQHHQYNPRAEHYLVVGPYDHITGQRGTVTVAGDSRMVLRGYPLDPVALLDIGELRYQWFDYVFRGGPKPALLKDKVNYQVMGANAWKHAPLLDVMGSETRRFYLSPVRSGETYRLSEGNPAGATFARQTVDLADRKDIDRVSPASGFIDKKLDTWNSVVYASDPLPEPVELSGLFSGRLDLVANRKDLDFYIGLYELTPGGEYFPLSTYLGRASYVADRTRRHLLTPGKRVQLDFKSGRLTGRQFQRGSRLVVLLSLIRQPEIQINYGSGKDVSDETIADAREPLKVKWFGSSFIDVPLQR